MDKEESWIKNYWRPAIAFQYLVVCIFDFILFPLATFSFAYATHSSYTQWDPITLKESGFYHLAMGAIIGVSAWTRGLEKINKITAVQDNISASDAAVTTTTQTTVSQ